MRNVIDCCYEYAGDYLVYTTKKELRVTNPFIGCINLTGLLIVSLYVIVYTFILDKGYQKTGIPTGYVSTKVKGIAYNTTENFDEYSFFESTDLIQPSIEMDGLFITTALTQTWQKRSICDGEDECVTDDNCSANATDSNGVATGDCLGGYCQQYRYCPAENDTITIDNKLIGVENFTIFLKVALNFEDFGVTLVNTDDKLGTGSLVDGYNLFTVSDILDECGLDIDDITASGALILGYIKYDCDFDVDDNCEPYPEFKWEQEDTNEDSVSSGYNFRKAYYSLNANGTTDRLLVKYHGIRIRFSILGQGGQFDMGAFSTTLGSGIALTAISAFITEFLLRHCITERKFYTDKRMEIVTMEQEEEDRVRRNTRLTEQDDVSSGYVSPSSEIPELPGEKDPRYVPIGSDKKTAGRAEIPSRGGFFKI